MRYVLPDFNDTSDPCYSILFKIKVLQSLNYEKAVGTAFGISSQ